MLIDVLHNNNNLPFSRYWDLNDLKAIRALRNYSDICKSISMIVFFFNGNTYMKNILLNLNSFYKTPFFGLSSICSLQGLLKFAIIKI